MTYMHEVSQFFVLSGILFWGLVAGKVMIWLLERWDR